MSKVVIHFHLLWRQSARFQSKRLRQGLTEAKARSDIRVNERLAGSGSSMFFPKQNCRLNLFIHSPKGTIGSKLLDHCARHIKIVTDNLQDLTFRDLIFMIAILLHQAAKLCEHAGFHRVSRGCKSQWTSKGFDHYV